MSMFSQEKSFPPLRQNQPRDKTISRDRQMMSTLSLLFKTIKAFRGTLILAIILVIGTAQTAFAQVTSHPLPAGIEATQGLMSTPMNSVQSIQAENSSSIAFSNGVFSGPTPWVTSQDAFYKTKASQIKNGTLSSKTQYLPPEICAWTDPYYLEGGMAYSVTVITGLKKGDIIGKVYDQYWTEDHSSGTYERFNGGNFYILIDDYTHNGGTNRIYDWLHYIVKESDDSYTLVSGQGVYYLISGRSELPDVVGYGFRTTETLNVYRGGTLINPQVSSRGYTYSTAGVEGGTIIGTQSYSNDQDIANEYLEANLAEGNVLSLPSGRVSATFNSSNGGSADVALATYGSNPGSNVGTLIGSGNTFHDIYVTNLTDPDATLTVQVAANATGQVLCYWDGSQWRTVHSNDWSIPAASGSPPKITVVFGANSRPRLSDLSGTPIVSSSPEAVAIQFSSTQVVQGQPITAKVVAKSTNLYGVELHLTFDANRLQVGSLSLGGDLLAESIAQNVYNNTAGTIDFAFSQQAPTPPQSGDDIELATITFYGGSSTGSATVGYASTPSSIFSDPEGIALATYPGSLDAQPGSVTVIQSATVSGVVLLQGRSNHAGANISTTTGGNFQTVTASNGAFALTGLTPNTVSYTIKASLPGYLDAIRATATYNPGNNTLPTITLIGGDTTHDQQINILDLALIGGRFGSSNYQADLNADGTVNILDLTMAAANFGKTGPRTW